MLKPTTHFEVTRDWLHAIGQRGYAAAATFEVLRSWKAAHLTMAELRVPWQASPFTVVCDFRGRFT